MRRRLWTLLPAAAFLALGCSDTPTGVGHDEEVTIQLTLSSAHAHTLSEITFTVAAFDDNGAAVTDFDVLRVERRLHGATEWRGLDLTLQGTTYTGAYTFVTSGEYDIQVVGARHGHTEVKTLHTMANHLEVARAHENAGGYRIEFETFPGHVHEGETATVRFWVLELAADPSGNRAPITGLDAEIHCTNPDGTNETHAQVEAAAGVYETQHTFMGGGEAHFEIHFTGSDGLPAEVDFHPHVAHGH